MVNKLFKNLCLLSIILVLLSSCAKHPADTSPNGGGTAENTDTQAADENKENKAASDINGDLKALASSHDGYNITPADSEKLFEVARDFVFDNIRDFSDGKPDLLSFAYYVATIFDFKYNRWDEEHQCSYVEAASINEIAEKYFGFSYELDGDDRVELPIGSYSGPSIMDFVRYEVEDLGEEKKVTAVARSINVFSLPMDGSKEQQENREIPEEQLKDYTDDSKEIMFVINYMREHKMTNVFDAVKEIIVSGKGDSIYGSSGAAVRICYLSDDGYTPKKFLSFEKYADGWQN